MDTIINKEELPHYIRGLLRFVSVATFDHIVTLQKNIKWKTFKSLVIVVEQRRGVMEVHLNGRKVLGLLAKKPTASECADVVGVLRGVYDHVLGVSNQQFVKIKLTRVCTGVQIKVLGVTGGVLSDYCS